MTSEEILAAFMANSQQQNRWNSPQNLMNMATLGLNGIAGLAGGVAQGRQDAMSAEDQAYQRAVDEYQRRLQARSGLSSAIMGQLDSRAQAGRDVANASPLGGEQEFAQSMAKRRAVSGMAEQFSPLRPGPQSTVGGFVAQTPNLMGNLATPDYRANISNEATNRSIQDRRNVVAGLSADTPDKLARENQLMQLLVSQMEEASKPVYQAPTPQAQPQEKKQGFWGKFGNVLKVAAPIAAAFIPGVGPLAAMGIGAAGSAAGSALSGGGVKGAVLGGLAGGASAYGLDKVTASQGLGMSGGAPRSFSNSMTPQSFPAGSPVQGGSSLQLPSSFDPSKFMGQLPQGQPGGNIMQSILGQRGSLVPQPGRSVPTPQPTYTPNQGTVRMIAPDGHTAQANASDVQQMIKLGWKVAPGWTPQMNSTPAGPRAQYQ